MLSTGSSAGTNILVTCRVMTLAMVDKVVPIVIGRLKQVGNFVALSWGYSSEIAGFCGSAARDGDSRASLNWSRAVA